MKKLASIIIFFLIGSSLLSSIAFSKMNQEDIENITEKLILSNPVIVSHSNYVDVELPEATSKLYIAGKPIIPVVTKVYKLPFLSKVDKVSVEFHDIHMDTIPYEIAPSPAPMIDGNFESKTIGKSEELYQADTWYPNKSFSYRLIAGLSGEEHIVYLVIQCYPIQYNPSKSLIRYARSLDISIGYEKPRNPMVFNDKYNLLVIGPAEFEQALQPLLVHKNSIGINTTFVSVEEILDTTTQGFDDAENIKLFIKDAVENWGVTYVLLVGGMKGQKFEWYTPVRYSNNRAGYPFESGYLSDLYFADLYKNNGSEFEDWDSNGNNIFGEFSSFSVDIIDGAPDIYIGRLPCRSIEEVNVMVNKIITYETTGVDDSWYKKMLCIGGDTYPESAPGAYEAEIDTNLSASYMTGFTIKRLWASTGSLRGQSDVEDAWNEGAGLVHMAGHANPSILVTFPPEDVHKEQKITIMRMYAIPPLDAFYAFVYRGKGFSEALKILFSPVNPRLHNKEKLPIVVVGGCHNSQFNTSLQNIIIEGFTRAYGYGIYVPKCWSWWLTSKEDGGAIATMGNTGLGMGLPGFDYPNGLDGWLFPRFFYHYGQLGAKHVGEAHSAAITDYVIEFDINHRDEGGHGSADRQMVEQWVLFGDPSLRMGGYP
ncbi:MAG: hypothetical protein DRN12_07300 [Thermoplasmata archaeon]|nr:MAG: hypothetical protein DRN12_07300 [Thermoplasmata archaeon]